MKILLTGATGYIGSSVLDVLRAHGHDVVAPVRSAHAAQKATAAGATAVVGDITDAAWFTPLLEGVDAAIHTAAPVTAARRSSTRRRRSRHRGVRRHRQALHPHRRPLDPRPVHDLTEQTPFQPARDRRLA
jgi:uncharacterized protein YbjT (DUF2867 family)